MLSWISAIVRIKKYWMVYVLHDVKKKYPIIGAFTHLLV